MVGGSRGDGRRILEAIFRLEVKLLLRDKRTVLMAVVVPLVLLPLLIFIMRAAERMGRERVETTTYAYAVRGPEAELARELIGEALALPAERGDWGEPALRFMEQLAADPDSLLAAGELHLVIEGLAAAEYREERQRELEGDSAALAGLEGLVEVPVLRVYFRGNSELSSTARRRLQGKLEQLRVLRRNELLRERGLELDPAEFGQVVSRDVASAARAGGAMLGKFLTPLIVLLILTGCNVVAADAISGEKERGTLETLLTTAATRQQVVSAKQIAIVAVGVAITLINVANLVVYVVSGLFQLPEGLAVSPEPAALIVILALYLALTGVISAALLVLSGYSKSYKEYQINFFPVFLLFAIPAGASVLPGIDLRSAIALVPIANVSVAVREVLVGEFDWPFLALTFAVTIGVAVYGSRLTSQTLSTERLITAAELEAADIHGGPALFPKRVIRWFMVLWVALFIGSLWFGADLGIRGQVALNLLGIFLGGSLLMLWRYRLNVREALALRPVRAPVWIAVLIGAPSAFLVGIGVARLANLIFPVPERLIEAFGQYLLAPDLALWEVVLLLAVLPGVCEEIAFRGVLLHGLSKRFHPVVLALVVGAIFGLFHVSLFRILPTAFLGATLAAVVLLTGSIFPAMLWHALNNAVALVPAYLEVTTEAPPLWTSAVGLVGLVLAFRLLWRYRSPYPDLRGTRSRDVR